MTLGHLALAVRDSLGVESASATSERCRAIFAYASAALIAAALGYFVARTPFQVSDNLGNLLTIQSVSMQDLLAGQVSARGYLRPLLLAQIKVVFDLADTRYFAAFRGLQVAQLGAVLVLFVRMLRARTVVDVGVVPLAIATLVGLHTFNITLREAYPINTFLSIVLSCVVAMNLSMTRSAWWVDASAVALTAYALFTLETGALVIVIFTAAYLAGLRGVSRAAMLAAGVVLAGYVYLRFGPMRVGIPDLLERSAGFGVATREPAELARLFAGGEFLFYGYNVACSLLTVLFSEPRGGVWILTRDLLAGDVQPWMIINVGTSALAMLLLGRFVMTRAGRWRRGDLADDDRLFLVFLAVLFANAFISFPYTKDVIMSPAGVFYAAAVFVATRDACVSWSEHALQPWAAAVVWAILLAHSVGWTARAAGLPITLRYAAFVNRNDWATLTDDDARPGSAAGQRLVEALRREAVRMPVPNPHFTPRWIDRYVDPY